ncbi:MAG TPA: hypothetical protein PKI24_24070 [Nitrospira sp.]|nr:hypothetical protein [Nitrospira sp.]
MLLGRQRLALAAQLAQRPDERLPGLARLDDRVDEASLSGDVEWGRVSK